MKVFQGTERFTVERHLGAGAFGVVYQVFDHQLQERVALKTLHKDNAGALYRFKREFRVLSDLNHPNLVTLYELLSDGEQWFFTMELLDGQNFLEYVCGGGNEKESPWSTPRTRRTRRRA